MIRSAEEWATYCHKESHWIAWSAGQGGAERILCINCARAYAREVGEAVRGETVKIAKETIPWNMPVPCPDGQSGCCVNHTVSHFRRRSAEEIAAAIRQIEVRTP